MRAIYAVGALALLAACASAADASAAATNPAPGPPGPTPGAGCSMIKDKKECKHRCGAPRRRAPAARLAQDPRWRAASRGSHMSRRM